MVVRHRQRALTSVGAVEICGPGRTKDADRRPSGAAVGSFRVVSVRPMESPPRDETAVASLLETARSPVSNDNVPGPIFAVAEAYPNDAGA